MSYIKLDREREVRIRNKAISQIEKRYKKTFTELLGDADKWTADDHIFILYQGLKHEDSQLTLEQVDDLVDAYANMKDVTDAIIDAAFEAYGTTRGEAIPNLQAAE